MSTADFTASSSLEAGPLPGSRIAALIDRAVAAANEGDHVTAAALATQVLAADSGNADAEGSTLRKTLGVLLGDELGIELRRVGSGARRTFAGGEAVLTQWMAEHVLVSWVARPKPWLFERELIAALDVPLNMRDNERNRFHHELKRLRRAAVLKANKSRSIFHLSSRCA